MLETLVAIIVLGKIYHCTAWRAIPQHTSVTESHQALLAHLRFESSSTSENNLKHLRDAGKLLLLQLYQPKEEKQYNLLL